MNAGCWLEKINGMQEQEIGPTIESASMLNIMKDDMGKIDVKGSRCTNVPMYLLRCLVERTLQGTMMKILYFLQHIWWHCYRRLSTRGTNAYGDIW